MSRLNLFQDLAPTAAERLETLFAAGPARIERIVSWGQSSPPGFWYDQAQGEWVALLRGRARLRLSEPDEVVALDAGDWLWIAPRRHHRVEWTDPAAATVWLAVFVGPEGVMSRTACRDSVAYRTLDGSQIRELMHPEVHGNRAQSLAEATIPAGGRTLLHRHRASEELYHVTSGTGRVWLADRWVRVEAGDTVCIPPGTPHCAQADDDAPLVILCCCSPAYAHRDTDLLDDAVPPVAPQEPSAGSHGGV